MQIFVAECVVCARGRDERKNVQNFVRWMCFELVFLRWRTRCIYQLNCMRPEPTGFSQTLSLNASAAFTSFFGNNNYYQRERANEEVGRSEGDIESGVKRLTVWTHLKNCVRSCRLPLIVGNFKFYYYLRQLKWILQNVIPFAKRSSNINKS